MKSTGEVMGIAENFPAAFGKAVAAAGAPLPLEGSVFLSVCDSDKSAATILAARLHQLGFKIYATRGTATALTSLGIPVSLVNKVFQGEPHVVNLVESGEIVLVINTPFGRGARSDGYEIRTAALRKGVPSITTLAGASAAVSAIEAAQPAAGAGTLSAGPAQGYGGAVTAMADGRAPGQRAVGGDLALPSLRGAPLRSVHGARARGARR